MDKRIAGLLGAAAALTTITAANAAVPTQANEPAGATSYRDLLNPVPNALDALKADDAHMAKVQSAGELQTAQFFYYRHHHHHHHHHRYHHHHHHHHHHGYYRY